jgi:hypothetical protein
VSRNVLVVSTLAHDEPALRRVVGPDDRVKVVVPVVRQGFLDWLANDERAFSRAEEVAIETAETLAAEEVDAKAGEADLALAIRDALATFPADEIVVAVEPDEREALTEQLAPEGAAVRSVDGVPVRVVLVRPEPNVDRSSARTT